MGLRILRNLDLIVLGIALPVFAAAQLPILGWVAAAVAWVASRALQTFAERRAVRSGNRQVALGARAASLVGRLYLIGLAVLGAGLIDRQAGLTAGVLSVVVFTVAFITLLIVKPLDEAGR
jgi:membrane protein implicated in regulation of membrane protease activity